MALWGSRDSFAITGTIAAVNTSTTITGTSTTFLTTLEVGDGIVINGRRRKVTAITNNTILTIDTAWNTANVSGVTITGQDLPKYVPTSDIVANTIIGIDTTEAGVANNRNRGLNTPGWNNYVTYTDMHGRTRHKTETLAVLSGGMSGDASDDTVAEDS
jgi:hypothetical protein